MRNNFIKRILILFLSLFVIISVFVVQTSAKSNDSEINIYFQTKEEAQQLINQTTKKLTRDYHGYCGSYAHKCLELQGIIKSNSASYDGKGWYGAYKNNNPGNLLNDNWTYECYDGGDSLDKLLDKYDGKVYNLIVSMHSGSPFGHVFFVNAIIDGTVYFTESFSSSVLGANQKNLITISVDEFKEYYFSTGGYYNISCGGIVHFYEKDFYKPIIAFQL